MKTSMFRFKNHPEFEFTTVVPIAQEFHSVFGTTAEEVVSSARFASGRVTITVFGFARRGDIRI